MNATFFSRLFTVAPISWKNMNYSAIGLSSLPFPPYNIHDKKYYTVPVKKEWKGSSDSHSHLSILHVYSHASFLLALSLQYMNEETYNGPQYAADAVNRYVNNKNANILDVGAGTGHVAVHVNKFHDWLCINFLSFK